jgi:cellulose synthase/poly-beta-1,6-N-acetylglucosamine synthase-like glycosyltransferase
MLQVIYYILFIICLVYGLYYFFTGLFGFGKVPKINKHEPKTKFAVLIAARNEEIVIPELIQSLKNQKYPKELFDIYAIVNNCSDNTEKVAKKAGAKILNVDVPVKSKGEVLLWTKNKLKDTDYDAYIVFDADNIAHPNFLQRMNDAYQSGVKVAQGCRDAKNLSDNWISSSYSIYYYLQNFFFNRSRMVMGLSSSINGTGFMADKKFFEDVFKPYSLTEDVEFAALCTLQNEKVIFVEDALTYDEQPTDFFDSWKQRKRWSKGMVQCLKIYHKRLIHNMFKNQNVSCLDLYGMFVSPIVQVLSFVLAIVLCLFNFIGIQLSDVFSYMYAYTIIFFLISYVFGVLINWYIVVYNKRGFKEAVDGIFLFIIFIASWIPINIDMFFDRHAKWDPIKHNKTSHIVFDNK